MQLPTYKLRNKTTGTIKIVNVSTYAANLGSWADWEVIQSRHAFDTPDRVVDFEIKQAKHEIARALKPSSPAYGDAERAFDARRLADVVTEPTPAKDVPEGFTTAVGVVAKEEPVASVEVPVIGGTQTIALPEPGEGRKLRKQKNASNEEIL